MLTATVFNLLLHTDEDIYICWPAMYFHEPFLLGLVFDLTNTRTLFSCSDFRLISLETCTAVIVVQSCPSTETSRSPTRTLSASIDVSLIACTTGNPPFGVSMTIPSLPAGTVISNGTWSSVSENCSSKEASSEKMDSPICDKPRADFIPVLLDDPRVRS